MDQTEDQKLLVAAKLDRYHFLRRTLQVVISASLLSLLFFYYPGIFSFPYSLAHALERKYMFLICNGILAFLTKSSRSYSYSDENYSTVLGSKFPAVPNLSETKAAVEIISEDQLLPLESFSFGDEKGQEQESIEDHRGQAVEEHEEQEEQGNDKLYGDNYEDNSSENENLDEEGNGWFSRKQEEEEEEGMEAAETADEELTNADELNKKFEEFIRKMKEELRIQAQQQLITV